MFIIISSKKRININNIIGYQDTTKSFNKTTSYGIIFYYRNPISAGYESQESMWFKTQEERDEKLQEIDKLLNLQNL